MMIVSTILNQMRLIRQPQTKFSPLRKVEKRRLSSYAGGVPEISRWREPPDLIVPGVLAPAGAGELSPFPRPAGTPQGVAGVLRWFAPPPLPREQGTRNSQLLQPEAAGL